MRRAFILAGIALAIVTATAAHSQPCGILPNEAARVAYDRDRGVPLGMALARSGLLEREAVEMQTRAGRSLDGVRRVGRVHRQMIRDIYDSPAMSPWDAAAISRGAWCFWPEPGGLAPVR